MSGFDFQSGTGSPFNYFTYGTACSEVEIDCLTGDHQVSCIVYPGPQCLALTFNLVLDPLSTISPMVQHVLRWRLIA